MKLDNKLPYIQFHTNDWLTITRGLSLITKGFLIDLICITWSRRCVWIKLEEAKEIALRAGATTRQFEKIKKELQRYLTASGEFKFTILEEMMNDAINVSRERSKAAHKRWPKNEESEVH
jgi:hypothetical protein